MAENLSTCKGKAMKKTFNGTLFTLLAVVFTYFAIGLAQATVAFWHGDKQALFTFALSLVVGAFIYDVYYRLKNGKPQ